MGLTVNQLSSDFGGSNPSLPTYYAKIAQLAEHVIGNDEVVGSIPTLGSHFNKFSVI